TTDTVLYMYYGNANVSTDIATTTGVWDSDYLGAWHFNDNANDSAINSYNGTPSGGVTYVNGKIKKGIRTDASTEYINLPVIEVGATYTLSFWSEFPLYNTGSWRTLFQRQGGTYHHILVQSDGQLGIYNGSFYSSGYDIDNLQAGWHYITAVASSGTTKFYIDGSTLAGTSNSVVTEEVSRFGNHDSNQEWGSFDEIRISNTARSADWIATIYNNQDNVADFLSFGPEKGATVEFISIIDPDNGADTDYTSLSDWENAIETDLSVGTTKVFSHSTASGTIPDGSTVVGATSGAVATTTHMTASTTSAQIMLTNIASSTFQSGETVYIEGQATSSIYVILSNAGNWVITTAKCRSSSGSADTEALTIDGWTTTDTTYIKIYTDSSEGYRHSGVYSASAYRIATASPIIINESNVRIEGLQIYQNSDIAAKNAIEIIAEDADSDIRIYQNIIKGSGSFTTNSHVGIKASSSAKIYNNIIYGFNLTDSAGLYLSGDNFDYYIYNNTLVNSNTCMAQGDGSTVVAKNNIVQNCTNYFAGTYDSASDYNLSLDASAPGSNSSTSTSVTFLASTSEDFHLHFDDTGARNNGISLASDSDLAFSDDIDSQTRYYLWDIGADKYYGTNTAPMITSASSSPSETTMGADVTFSVDWTDADLETVKLYVCKNDSISTTTPGCDSDQTYCTDSYDWDSLNDPVACSYTTQPSEEGENYYYAFVCDDQVSCSTSTSGIFDVTATIIWDGSASTDWGTASNWNGNLVPTANHDVIINGDYSSAPTLNLNSGSATINSLSLGSTSASTLTLSNGSTTKKLIVSGGMIIGANGVLTHTTNTTAQTHVINLEAVNLTIESGGSINVEAKGYKSIEG
ncbi:hypothetical protein DRH27_06065, partial [Candidatus Falkowbacteria bacterium]